MSTIPTLRDVLVAPVVSEKTYAQIEDGHYTFRVHRDAHKTQVRQAVEEIWNVQVDSVRIVNVRPKPKRSPRSARRGLRPGYKKAIVRLRPGYSIALFEGLGG
jgi:large subunit ribosomal protein L23